MADFVDIQEVLELEGFVNHINSRAQSLNRSVQELEGRQSKFESDFYAFRKSSKHDIEAIKDDIAFLKSSVREVQKMIILMISQMKNTLKKTDYDRFEKRLDLWAPENLVNREEAKRILQKINL